MRQFLFVGVQYDRDKEAEYLAQSKKGLSGAVNEFQWNACDGLIEHIGDQLKIFSALPVGTYPKHYKKLVLEDREWQYRQVPITEIGCVNLPIIKQYSRKRKCYRLIKKWLEETPGDEHVVILYSLYLPYLQAISKLIEEGNDLRGIVIVTDLPGKYGILPPNKVKACIMEYIGKMAMERAKSFHGFVLLTEEMKWPLEIADKPYIIVEGIAKKDCVVDTETSIAGTAKYILYTGSLNRKYGITDLLNVFEAMNDPELELWICGTGTAEKDVQARAEQDPRIKYLGFQLKREVLKLQKEATVLVNPRTSEGEYTKYSFPSKTMEYMASGVPVVMHKLAGVPNEYEDYVVFAEDDSCEALRDALLGVIEWDEQKRKTFGERARSFVNTKKSPVVQAQRMIDLVEELFE